MAERPVGDALWYLHGLLAALKDNARSAAESNAIFDGIQDLSLLGELIRVPLPDPQALQLLKPQFGVPARVREPFKQADSSGFAATVPALFQQREGSKPKH